MSQFENVKHERLIVYKTTSPNDCFWILLKEKVDPKQVPTKTYTCVYVTNCLKKNDRNFRNFPKATFVALL